MEDLKSIQKNKAYQFHVMSPNQVVRSKITSLQPHPKAELFPRARLFLVDLIGTSLVNQQGEWIGGRIRLENEVSEYSLVDFLQICPDLLEDLNVELLRLLSSIVKRGDIVKILSFDEGWGDSNKLIFDGEKFRSLCWYPNNPTEAYLPVEFSVEEFGSPLYWETCLFSQRIWADFSSAEWKVIEGILFVYSDEKWKVLLPDDYSTPIGSTSVPDILTRRSFCYCAAFSRSNQISERIFCFDIENKEEVACNLFQLRDKILRILSELGDE
nr:hypothetical protein pmam_131 [Pithovirus mammoth]